MDYVYIEYPKCLYQRSGEMVTVANAEEEALCASEGYRTAEQFHGSDPEPDKKKRKPA